METISPEQLHELLQREGPRDFRLIDVREDDEYAICHLEKADLISVSKLAEQAATRLPDKDETLIIYCHHGIRSMHAAEWLYYRGYKNVFNLTGGIEAWAQQVDPTMARY